MPPARPVTTSSAPQRVRKSAANAQKGTPRAKAASSEVASVEQVDTSYLQTLMGYNARRAALSIIGQFLERMAPYGLKPVDFSVMSTIHHNPGVTSRQLCAALNLLPPNLVGLIQSLEARGLIERKPHPHDGRAVGLHATPQGQALMAQAEQTAAELELEKTARELKPALITVGASAYSRTIDFERMGKLAREIGAYFMVDMAHYAGLIAAGVYPNPVPHADVVTSTTHKSLRGPRGGIILMKAEHEKAINSAIFPGLQGGPLMHVIAAKAVAFKEALGGDFKAYQQQVLTNADIIAKTLTERGLRIVSGGTESHVMLVDLRPKNLTGKEAEAALGLAHMTCNKNGIPNDPQKPMVTSGIRLGTPALTTRGFMEEQTRLTAHLIADVLDNPHDEANLAAVRAKVAALTRDFPVYR